MKKNSISRNDFLHELKQIATIYKSTLQFSGARSDRLTDNALRRALDLLDIVAINIDNLPEEFRTVNGD